tara:strand:- start:3029 stop:7561 length:4533 start_codon:yes stop_codon:yes gene_type:complete
MPDYTLVESLVELTENAIAETQEIFTAATSYGASSTSTSEKLTPDADYYNPLNPKTKANLKNIDSLKKRGPYTPTSKTVNRRWTSVQAWNYSALNNDQDPDMIEVGLVISVNIAPQNGGAMWDHVVHVEDSTIYNPTAWSSNTIPTDNLATVNTGTHIELRYAGQAFNTPLSVYNIVHNNGMFPMSVKVHYQSGHVEDFEVLAPVGAEYRVGFLAQGAYNYTRFQETTICEFKANSEWYSKGKNTKYSSANPLENYHILTRYSPTPPNQVSHPTYNPSGTLIEAGYFKSYYAQVYDELHLLNSIQGTWYDPLAHEFGFNGATTPDQTQMARQKFYRIDVLAQDGHPANYHETVDGMYPSWFTSNYNQSTNSPDIYVDDSFTGGDVTAFQGVIDSVFLSSQNQIFTFTAYYSHNITDCGGGPPPVRYFVCDTPGNPGYYLTTGLGSLVAGSCNTMTIPAADLPGGGNYANVTYVHDDACCTTCTLQLTASTLANASYNTNNGKVVWNATSAGNSSGNPYSSGSMYTVIVTNAAGTVVGTAPPSGGNSITNATCDTTSGSNIVVCDATALILPGMQVSGTGIPAGTHVYSVIGGTVGVSATQFTMHDNAFPGANSGNPVSATASNTNTTLTFSIGNWGHFGGLAPNDASNTFYKLCVSDDDDCEECTTFIITEAAAPSGCTDSSATNYNSAAVVDDGSCVLCEASDGLLHDPSGNSTTPLFDSLTASGSPATAINSTSHNSDGTLAVSAAPIASLISYIDFDVNSYFEIKLYKTVNQGDDSTAAGATLIATQNTGTLNLVTIATHNFTSLAYGYYTMRVRYVDTNSTKTLENCWTEWYGIVQAEVCDDVNNGSYNSSPVDPVLRFPNAALCISNPPCCQVSAVSELTNGYGSICAPILFSDISCDPNRSVEVEWLYSATGTGYTSLGTYALGWVAGWTHMYATASNVPTNTNWASINGSGFYKVIIYAQTAAGHVCQEERIINYTEPISGCTDASAYNYDPLAVCPGTCAFPSWDCDGQGNCIDPWQGTLTGYTPGAYNCLNGAGCCQPACPIPPIYGCTDACATNYDPTAAVDDGSCLFTVCSLANATNYNQSCCNNNYYSASQIVGTDNSCCIMPCTPDSTIDAVTGLGTSTCVAYNNDGTVYITVTVNNSAPTWRWLIENNAGNIIYEDVTGGPAGDGIYHGTTTSQTYSLLAPGNYTASAIDSFGCEWYAPFTIGSTSPEVGCTDPDASNYDPLAQCDCCCIMCGCLDPSAINYSPNSSCPGDCEYGAPMPSPCVPVSFYRDLERVRACLSLEGSYWIADYKIGMADDCTLMNKWKLILIEYLLGQMTEGISCLFNCADVQTPDPSSAQDCNELWITGGPSTGLNHNPNHEAASITSGEGTTVTGYDGYPLGWYGQDTNLSPANNNTFVGDVIKWDLPTGHIYASALNGTVWQLTTDFGNGGAHFGCSSGKIKHYTQCLDSNMISITTTINYYDNFLNFVNKFCKDCNTSILQSRWKDGSVNNNPPQV